MTDPCREMLLSFRFPDDDSVRVGDFWLRHNVDIAERWYLAAIAINPKNSSTLYRLAERRMEAKRYAEAIALFRKSNASFHHNVAMFKIAKCYFLLGKYESSLRWLRAILKEYPTHEGALNYRRKVLDQLRRQREERERATERRLRPG